MKVGRGRHDTTGVIPTERARTPERGMLGELSERIVFYRRPNWLTQRLNGALAWLAARGIAPSDLVALEVRGRKTGRPRVTAVTWVEVEGQRYLVSPRGMSEWVRNVRAAGGDAIIRHGAPVHVRLEEIPSDRRAPVLRAYLRKTKRATQSLFGLRPDAPLEEFAAIAERHPVFRIVEASDPRS